MRNKYRTISVIIPVYNGENFINRCIDALINQSYPSEYIEIIIIDNGSTDNTINILNRYKKNQIKIFECKKPGPSAARNLGIKKASNELLLLIDADCIASKNLIIQHLDAHNFFTANNPAVKVIGGGMGGINKNFWATCDDFCSWYKQHPGIKEKYIDFHPTANLSFSKDILKTVGLFDEDLKYSEDFAFCENIKENGYKIYFKPKASVFHINRTSFKHFINHAIDWTKTQYLLREKKIIKHENRNDIVISVLHYILLSNYEILNILIHAIKVKRYYVILFLPFIMLNKYIVYYLELKSEISFLRKRKENTI